MALVLQPSEIVKAAPDVGGKAQGLLRLGAQQLPVPAWFVVSTEAFEALGFLVLTLASVKSLVFFGLLSSVAMISALAADLVVLPAILVTARPRL
jgi:hypothetical protein